jgi:hypothetical protein
MRMNLKVMYLDESAVDVSVTAADFVAFEREFSRSVAKFEQELRLTDICWLAWRSLSRRAGLGVTGDFDTWLETIEGVEFGEAVEIPPLAKSPNTSA